MKAKRIQDTQKNRRAQGASRRAAPRRRLPLRWLAWLAAAGCVVAAAVLGLPRWAALPDTIDRPVASIAVQGEFLLVSKERVMALLEPLVDQTFLQLDLAAIKTEVEKAPFIDRAILGRRWPDQLVVTIVEQQPIARWGRSGFLNQRGQIVATPELDNLQGLPLLSGNRAQSEQVMLIYQGIAKLLRPYGLSVMELRSDPVHSVELVLSNDLRLVVGRDQIMKKMQRFLAVYTDDLQAKVDSVASIDLRYNNGVAVKWREGALASAR
ncbi:FtsQ-type POTRA domain-containing protein [Exilibacterium tricleocarpae]|uniref:Cell division protein FtsQ n=1 Tax=Exilibacterium tricleocarpae TaxID=2591008 RepID=A0A545TQE2_9GAMM|nr:cell division protein FtsQ/DivIB [Exilibacterium tricleocarpae]TQV79427.1 FtsQ-type POTRA domain-containing protein [Exilibacterium tricleocarpae]